MKKKSKLFKRISQTQTIESFVHAILFENFNPIHGVEGSTVRILSQHSIEIILKEIEREWATNEEGDRVKERRTYPVPYPCAQRSLDIRRTSSDAQLSCNVM